jgi:hypothetical protein
MSEASPRGQAPPPIEAHGGSPDLTSVQAAVLTLAWAQHALSQDQKPSLKSVNRLGPDRCLCTTSPS